MERNIIFSTYQTLAVSLIIILVNVRYVICDIFDIPPLPITLFILLLELSAIDYRKIRRKEVIVFVALIFLIFKSFSTISLLMLFLFVVISIKVSFKLIWVNLISISFLLLLCFYFIELGVITNVSYYSLTKECYTLGFSNPNISSLYFYSLIITFYLAYFKEGNKIISLLFISIIAVWSFDYTKSRTVLIGSLILLLSVLLCFAAPKTIIKNKILLQGIYIGFAFCSLYFCYFCSQYPILNIILSGRLGIMGDVLKSISPIDWLLGFNWPKGIPQDNAYITMLSNGGVMGLLFYYYGFKTYIKDLHIKQLWSLPAFISVITAGLTEYIFVGLNMMSISLTLIIFKIHRDATSLNNITCFQCRKVS